MGWLRAAAWVSQRSYLLRRKLVLHQQKLLEIHVTLFFSFTIPFKERNGVNLLRAEAAAACVRDPYAGSRPNGTTDRLKRSPSVAPLDVLP